MQNVPEDIGASLVRSIGAYLRATPNHELPGPLRRFKGFRAQTLATRHRADLLARLEDDALRKRLVNWLDKDKPSLSKRDEDILRLACERPRGWRTELEERSRKKRAPKTAEQRVRELESRLATERDRARKARDDTKAAKEETRAVLRDEKARRGELEQEIARLRADVRVADKASAEASAASQRAAQTMERERRKTRSTVAKAETDRDAMRAELKDARKQVAELTRRVRDLEARRESRSRRVERRVAPPPTEARRALGIPKGLLPEAPEALAAWLRVDGVRLLVDGYNLSKTEGAYGDLALDAQRERVTDEVGRLAHRHGVEATVVFDGSEVPPGIGRPRKGPLRAEYSRPGETADDHVVALLETWPGDPVVVVTSDRGLQERSAALGATIATSPQLLALIR